MLRNRDIVATVLALILTRMAWNDQAENLSASIHLAFYFPFVKDQVAPAAFDVDGDGTSEAIVTVKPYGGGNWVVQILDLKPLHSGYATAKTAMGAPFQPRELLRSEPLSFGPGGGTENPPIKPLQIITGQVMVRGLTTAPTEQEFSEMSHEERTKHYFCGDDWHDAASKCGTPCPSGTADECPGSERCYADTPCDSSVRRKTEHDVHEDSYHLTPAGGLPSCFTVWSDGRVTMHSLTSPKDGYTADESKDQEGQDAFSVASIQAKLKRTLKQKKTPLELKEMWTTNSLPRMPAHIQTPAKIQLTYLDAFDAIPDAKHGMLIVSGDLTPDAPPVRPLGSPPIDPMAEPRFIVALDAMTGEVLWDSLQNFEDKKEEAVPLPVQLERGSSSLARRRSKVVKLDAAMSTTGSEGGDNNHGVLPNCLTGYRYSLLGATDALPYSYWGPEDAGIRAVHLDHSNTQRKFHRHDQHHAHKHRTPLSSSTSSSQNHKPGATSPHHHHHGHKKIKGNDAATTKTKKSWHSALINPRRRAQSTGAHGGHVHYGRPNVIVNYHAGGLHVHSLQNGQPICHLSMLEESLYIDLQQDGVMDSIQIVTNGKNIVLDPMTGTYADPWVAKLAEKLADQEEKTKTAREKAMDARKPYHKMSRMCHALALSGMPAREELFSTPLCGTGSKRGNHDEDSKDHPWTPIYAAPPLVVESLYPQHRHREKDVIFAMNNGAISRVSGGTGRRQWKLSGKNTENFPSWGGWEASHTVSFTRLQVDDFQVAAHARPLLLVGESSLAILSATSANILATSNIPQRSLRRPILADVSGDGVTDVLVTSADAIWGYQILVRTGASIFFRILVGLLLMGILLALLRNRYGGTSVRDRYKRSTDA